MLNKKKPICWFQYPKPPTRCTKILSPSNEKVNSLIEKYKIWNESVNHISLVEFVANFDTESLKKHKCNTLILWVSFNFHKGSENYYIYI
jgi:hypothetical protein